MCIRDRFCEARYSQARNVLAGLKLAPEVRQAHESECWLREGNPAKALQAVSYTHLVQPDAQVIFNPANAGTRATAIVIGLHVAVTF